MALLENTAPQANPMQNECITIIARSPGQALKEFHNRGLGKQGYAISGRVVPHKFDVINDDGEAEELFNGEHFYAATFSRTEESQR